MTPLIHECSLATWSAGSAAGVRPTMSRLSGPDTAYPPKMRKRKTSWRVATIITLSTMTSSVQSGRRRAKSNSLKLQYRNVETINNAATYVPTAIVRRSQAEGSTPLSRITADTTSPAAAGVGSPTKNRRSAGPVGSLERAGRGAPQVTDTDPPNPLPAPQAGGAHQWIAR